MPPVTAGLNRLFQSTLPLRGVTGNHLHKAATGNVFQSTLPLRGVTRHRTPSTTRLPVSIHTPLAGSDRPRRFPWMREPRFQSTLPLRGVTLATGRSCN